MVCPILGLILGDAATGLALGASLELLFMGITNIGGSIPSDVFLAGTIVTALCIGTGLDYETAVVLAAAIGARIRHLVPYRPYCLSGYVRYHL